MSRLATLIASIAFAATAAVTVSACKQQEGEQCQVNSDCADGLICRKVGRVCATDEDDDAVFDAGPDALAPDAQLVPFDAMPDAAPTPPDAEIPDATPTPDA
jgi:hypothetical protein